MSNVSYFRKLRITLRAIPCAEVGYSCNVKEIPIPVKEIPVQQCIQQLVTVEQP